ncbi:MAG: hypothetical protein ACKPCI_25360, partial [Dolichospermum sp.]
MEKQSFLRGMIQLSCYAPELYNPKMVKSCGVGILPARLIQIKYTTAYEVFASLFSGSYSSLSRTK